MQQIADTISLLRDCMPMRIAENMVELQRRIALYDDELAYKEIFFTYYGHLLRFARTFVDDRQSAEEIVSDVMMKIWEKRKSLTTIVNLRVYLYISTRNTALNYLSKQRKMEVLSLENLNIDFLYTALNPEDSMITAEMMRQINQAVSLLPPRCKLVFKLVKEDGLPYKEVAEILNISIKTIDNQLAIALRKISEGITLQLKLEY
jgi:RNA polymerase sigma-70 factor (family 1)